VNRVERFARIAAVVSDEGAKAMQQQLDWLYGSVPAEFESRFGLKDSVGRLSAATRRSAFPVTEPVAVGQVSEDRVSIRRMDPLGRNSFAPCFIGEFRERQNGVVLTGHFALPRSVQVFMAIWLGFAFFIGLVALASGLPLRAVMLIGMGVAGVLFGKWLSRDDIPWLSRVIQDALSG
jgi:hypothetical protein